MKLWGGERNINVAAMTRGGGERKANVAAMKLWGGERNANVAAMTRGVSLVEMLIVLAISGGIGLALVAFTRTTSQAQQAQQDWTTLEQNLAVALHVLQSDLRLAGFRGDATVFSGTWQPADQASVLRWMGKAWQTSSSSVNFKQGTTAIESLGGQFRDGSLASSTRDDLELSWTERLNGSTGALQICLKRVFYDLDPSQQSLRRSENLWLSAVQTVGSTTNVSFQINNNNCQPIANAGTARPQPLIGNVEDFQIAFLDAAGQWFNRPEALLPGQVRAVGVYLRMRSDSLRGASACGPWPNPQTLPVSAAELGIREFTYSVSECNRRRLERFVTIGLPNPQAYEVSP